MPAAAGHNKTGHFIVVGRRRVVCVVVSAIVVVALHLFLFLFLILTHRFR